MKNLPLVVSCKMKGPDVAESCRAAGLGRPDVCIRSEVCGEQVREDSDLKLKNIDGQKLFPPVALKCMPTLQLTANETYWFTLFIKGK